MELKSPVTLQDYEKLLLEGQLFQPGPKERGMCQAGPHVPSVPQNKDPHPSARTSSYTGDMRLNSCLLLSDSCPGTKALRGPGTSSYAVPGAAAGGMPLLLAARGTCLADLWCLNEGNVLL